SDKLTNFRSPGEKNYALSEVLLGLTLEKAKFIYSKFRRFTLHSNLPLHSMATTSLSTVGRGEIINAFEGIAPERPSSSILSTQKPYDVFINHRGPDVKHTLAATLYDTLNRMGLKVFLDSEELELGDFLPEAIQEAMRTSSLHIAIFSEKYAQSPWCLAELSFMLKTGTTIIPIFYHVQPADLRWVFQGKGMYVDDISEHERKGRYSLEKLQEWKMALYNVSFYSGHIINYNDDKQRLLKNIVNLVLKVMNKVPLEVAKHPIGLSEAVKEFEMIALQSAAGHPNVQIVGIWGMGGSGKTTLAKKLYNIKCSFWQKSSFVFDVRDAATKGVLHYKQIKLLEDLGFKASVSFDNIEQGKGILANRFRSIKVLIILDDVDHVDQLDALMPAKDVLGWGSLIIVTTRELEVLRSWGISSVYRIRTLDPSHAKQLFCWHAFLQSFPLDGFEILVEKFLNVCNGLPLSLKVFGGQLYGNSDKDYWESQLHKISRILPNDVKQRLKISYDALDEEEKEIFLDTACFFIGVEKSSAIAVWDGSGWSSLHSWERLVSKCLVELDEKNHIRMHDHLRDLGREIANQQSPYRFCLPGQIINVEKQADVKRGIPNQQSPYRFCFPGRIMKRIGIRGIMATTVGLTSEVEEFPCCSSHGKLIVNTSGGFWRLTPSELGLKIFVVRGPFFNEVMGKVSRELIWLRWIQIGQRYLPSRLSLKKLRVLELYEERWEDGNHLEELWEANTDVSIFPFRNFKSNIFRIVVCFRYLIDNVLQAPVQLRELVIFKCKKFKRFPKSLGSLKHLKKIVVSGGSDVRSLPEEFCLLQSLEHLQLRCGKLSSLPGHFGDLRNLRHLDLSGCSELSTLPISFNKLTLLHYLNFSWCNKLTFNLESGNLDILENMAKLEYLNLSGCWKLKELPRHITNQASLRELNVRDTRLRGIPINIGQLSKLRVMEIGSHLLRSLPSSFGNLSSLTNLIINWCSKLESLPDSLGCLNLLEDLTIFNSEVKTLPKSVRQLINLQTLKISRCPILELDFGPASISSSLFNLKFIQLHDIHVSKILISEDCCPVLEIVQIERNGYLTEIETLPTTVKDIKLHYCRMLKNISSIGGLVNLQELEIIGCPDLNVLPNFAQLTCLTKLAIDGPNKVDQKIEGLEHCTLLEKLVAHACWEVQGIESLEHMERLWRVELIANKRSAIQPCIQMLQVMTVSLNVNDTGNNFFSEYTSNYFYFIFPLTEYLAKHLQKWPGEMIICTRADFDAGSLVNMFAFPNLSVVDSIAKAKIDGFPILRQRRSSNVNAIMVCLIINCVSPSLELKIWNEDNDLLFATEVNKGKWVWIGVFTQPSIWLTTREYSIYDTPKRRGSDQDEVEKGLLIMEEGKILLETFHSLWALLGN
ncbi:hypothetical protein KI387_032706, partial [Taxus chinensis]